MSPKTTDYAPERLGYWKSRATEDRAGLREMWDRAQVHLEPLALAELAKHLAKIRPLHLKGDNGWVAVEPPFRLRPKERRALATALLESGVSEPKAFALVPGVSPSTRARIVRERASRTAETPKTSRKSGLNKPGSKSKRSSVGGRAHPPSTLSFDASSGGDLTPARHRELLRRLGVER